jgi:glycosyltransferase involved in cell wall biosynthesis
VKTFINKFNYGYPIGYVHLGCEKEDVEIKEIFLPRGKNVLMVSTIEPRKMYAKTIEQFERIWEKREDINLIIVGKKGWLVDELMEKIRTHPRRLTNLFHLTGLNESELNYLYKNADLFLFASEVEGFGLGVIEAGRFGTPLLLRDIPVFREIAGDHATYFDDFKNLPSIITDGLDKGFRRSDKMKVNSWKDTSVGILTLINDIRNKWIKANNSHLNSPSPLLNA